MLRPVRLFCRIRRIDLSRPPNIAHSGFFDGVVVFAQPADNAAAVVPAAQNDQVAGWVIASLVRVKGLAVPEQLDLDIAGRAFRHDVEFHHDIDWIAERTGSLRVRIFSGARHHLHNEGGALGVLVRASLDSAIGGGLPTARK